MTLRLHDYQVRAVKHLQANDRAGLFLEPGLGKTATVLTALTPDHLPAMVIAPKRVAQHVWPTETEKWRPDLTCVPAVGTRAQRQVSINKGADITVVTRDNLSDPECLQLARRCQTLVIDESSSFKSSSSKRFKYARALSKAAPRCWILTGTPTPNGLLDLWSQVFLLDHGDRLGTGITKYRNKWFSPGRQLASGVVTEWIPHPHSFSQITTRLDDICLSMKAADYLTMPDRIMTDHLADTTRSVMRVYEDMLKTLVADLPRTSIAAANAAVATNKLSQIAAGAMYLPDGTTHHLHDFKTDVVGEILEGTTSPVLLFYNYAFERERLLDKFPYAYTTDMPHALDKWNAGEVPLLLAHPAAAGHGLNLQGGGHTIVWTTLPWSSELWQQANGRLWRQGQEHPVVIHRVLGYPVDDAIALALDDKITLQDAVLKVLGENA